MDFGIDSLGAIAFRNLLEQKFAITLPATVAFDYPTASTMANYISSLLRMVPIHKETHAYAKAPDQATPVLQERILDIVRSILGTNVSMDQVPTHPILRDDMFILQHTCIFQILHICAASYGSGVGIN